MKRRILNVFLLVLLSSSLFASVNIKGKVVEGSTQLPLEFVNVVLYQVGSTLPLVGVATDKNGIFNIITDVKGKYLIRISMIGYQPIEKQINIDKSSIDLGIISLKEETKFLSEVEVVAQGFQMKFDIDKKVFSVDQNIASAGGSATEVLQNIPSVDVDNEGNISLRNNSNVEVWINGKPAGLTTENRAQVLQQMPAESIESIEIITNPSAKFDPEGTAGIINLVLKKNRKAGYYGSLSAGIMYPENAKLGKTLGGNFNYSSSKVDAYANIGYRSMNMKGGGWNRRYSYLEMDTTLLSQNNAMNHSFDGLFLRAGADFHLTDKNSIGISGFSMYQKENSSNFLDYLLTSSIYQYTIRDYNRNTFEKGTHPSYNLTLDYQHDFNKKGTNLMASLTYSNHDRNSEEQFIQREDSLEQATSDITQNTDNQNNNWNFKVDYTNKFTENNKLEAGWQSRIQSRNSLVSGVDNLQQGANIPSYYNNFDYDEQIHAAYVTYGGRFNRLSLQGGVRAEYMWKQITNETYDSIAQLDPQTYFQLFPSIYISYTLPQNGEIQLNYTRRVDRPRGRMINPFRDYTDSTNISFGNPELKPQFSSSYELNYLKNWYYHSLSFSAYYRSRNNVIQNVRYMHGNNMENTYLNITKTQNSGLEVVVKDNFSNVLNLTSSLNLYFNKLDSATYISPYNTICHIPSQEDFSWNARVIANVLLAKTFSAQISGNYSSPTIISQGKRKERYSIDLGLRKTFMDRKLNLSLMVRDLLNSRKMRSTTWGEDFYQQTESYFHGRMAGLTISYNFGNMKPASQKKKSTENNNGEEFPMDNFEGL